jgi:hypothetical protein
MLSLDVFIKVEVVSSFHGFTADPAGGGGWGGDYLLISGLIKRFHPGLFNLHDFFLFSSSFEFFPFLFFTQTFFLNFLRFPYVLYMFSFSYPALPLSFLAGGHKEMSSMLADQ